METIYLCIIIFLFVLAVFDLIVGVSNDAVNFLNSAVGAKAASFKTILFIAGIGIFIGASLSNGMMDIARHGIYQPEHFYFAEIMCILLAVMLTDVVLLDVFNSMGMPTSTTVSLVFELLGGTFALSLIKVNNDATLALGDLINTDKALSVIMAIFVSVAIAFFFGMLVQWLARIVFTFNYTKNIKYSIGLFGGIAATSIIYFMPIKGLKDSSFMTPENKQWIQDNTLLLIASFFVFFTALMQVLHWLKVNVFKVVVLMGTFALALAFAGNDLVNFIGVPLAGYSSFIDYTTNGAGASPDSFLMTSLLGPAKTPWYFLIGAGAIMVYALCTSKKAHAVIKTSVDLSRQDEGEENFGSTPMARTLVRFSMTLANGTSRIMHFRLSEEEKATCEAIITSLQSEFQVNDNLKEEMLRILLKHFIIHATRVARKNLHITPDMEESFNSVRRFYVLVDQHFKEKKQVQDYADMLCKSPKTLSHLLSLYNLPSPLKVIHQRVEAEAKRLLLYSEMTAKEIAHLLGFEDQASFSRFFKKVSGESITQYKRQLKESGKIDN